MVWKSWNGEIICDVVGDCVDGLMLLEKIARAVGITLGFMYPLLAEAGSRLRVWSVPCRD